MPIVALMLAALLGGCRAGEGEACGAETPCHPDLRCYRDVCRTPQEVAKLKMAENDARWASQKQEVYETIGAAKKEIAKLKEKIAEADTDAERERLERMVDELQKTNAARDPKSVPTAAP